MNPADILIVDDNVANLQLLVDTLETNGYQARPVNSGSLALRAAEAMPPDLILLDIMMPDMDGYQVCEALKRNEHLHHIPIIFLSALQDTENVVHSFEIGGVDYITKPFQTEEVLARVKMQLELQYLRQRDQHHIRQLGQERNLLRTMIDALPDLIMVKDVEGRFILANQALAQISNLETPEELIGKTEFDLLPTELAQPFLASEQEIIRTGVPLINHLEQTIDTEGENVWLLTTKIPLYDENDEIVSLVGIGRDITERKYAEEQLKVAKEEAEIANRAKSTFLANMSHELRTPLNAILGFTELMGGDTALLDKYGDYLDIISHSGEHLLNLINDVLEISKIEAGQSFLNPKSFNLRALLMTVSGMFSIRAQKKQLAFQFTVNDSVPEYIICDEGKLRQIIMSLLDNAIKFTEDGHVHVHVTYKDHPTPSLNIEVIDTGYGISEEEQDILFEPFVQTQSGIKLKQGTGLGLTIAREFIQLMDGYINVLSNEGKGSTFTFDVPIQLTVSGEVPETNIDRKIIEVVNSNQYRILIADDLPINRKLIRRFLQRFGFQLQEAQNGREVIDVWSEWQPHIILMDMRMPVMNGYEATKHIKFTGQGGQSAIIAVTASGISEGIKDMLSVGCDDFIQKPIKSAILLEKVLEYLPGIEIIYEEIPTATIIHNNEATNISLAALPDEWIVQLQEAVEELDAEMMRILIENVRTVDWELAAGLENLVARYRFDKIETLISERNSK